MAIKYENKNCEMCSSLFLINPKNKVSRNKRFCCGVCAKRHNGKNNIGKKRTEEYKRLLSIKLTGEGNPFYGKKHNKEAKLKVSKANTKNLNDLQTVEISDIEMEVLHGILLADGHLESSSNGHSARLTYGCEFVETLHDIIKAFPNMRFSPIWKSEITGCYHIKSGFYKSLGDLKKEWYIPLKRVPENVIITPLSCFWWFIGDGYMIHYGMVLCTDALDVSVDILINKLKELDFNSFVGSRNRIRIRSNSISSFLRWITPENIPSQYLYKWQKEKRLCKKYV